MHITGAKGVISRMLSRFFDHKVPKTGAALAYFLLFAFFPMLIFVNALMGFFQIDLTGFMETSGNIIPVYVKDLVNDYFVYLGAKQSIGLMIAGILLFIYLASRAVNILINAVNKAYGIEESRSGGWKMVMSFFVIIVLMLQMLFTMGILIIGNYFAQWANDNLHLLGKYDFLWRYVAFAIVAVSGFFILVLMYSMSPNKKISFKQAMPGALVAEIGWLIVSVIYSFYLRGTYGGTSSLYGSLQSITVLLLWLYLSGIILTIGGEVNAMLHEMALETEAKKTAEESKIKEI